MRICSVEGCGSKHYGRGFCSKHHKRWETHGSPHIDNRSVRRPIAERFWEKVDKSGDCWNWTGAIGSTGYGHINEGGKGGKVFTASRVSWEIHHGQIENGLFVLHKCDNPKCVNPDHLFLGTHRDNMDDKVRKGRHKPARKLS